MSLPFRFALPFGLCCVVAAISGQAPVNVVAEGPAVLALQRQAVGLQVEGAGLLGLGPDYKARLDARGWSFVPALGQRAERLHPFDFELESIARGTHAVQLRLGAQAPRAEGLLAIYERGGGVQEIYEVRPEGLKQSFVFASEPAGEGDLVVRGRVGCELAGHADEGGLLFAAGTLGGVRLSPVVVVDAAGVRSSGWMRLVGDRLELGVPEATVESAAYPLVLDPLIGTEIDVESGTSNDDDSPDAAFSQEHNAYLVAWRRAFSGTDVDVRAQRVSATGALVGGLSAINSVGGICSSVNVAYVPLADRWMIAYNQTTGLFDDSDIYARSYSALTGGLSNEVALASTTANESSLELGAEATLADDDCLLVYALVGSGIRAVQVGLSATGDPLSIGATLVVSSDPDDSSPNISRSGGANGRYLVAWQRLDATTGFDLHGRVIDRNAQAVSSESVLSNSSGAETAVSVDGDGTTWLVVWQDNTPSGNGDGNILAASWSTAPGLFGTTILDTNGGTKVIESGPLDDEIEPAVAYNGEACVVAWSDESGGHYNVRAALVDLLSGNRCGEPFNFATSSEDERHPVLAAMWADQSTGASSDELLAVWDETDSASATGEIAAQRYSSDAGSIADLGGGCGNGGEAWAPCAVVGNANFALSVLGTAQSATSFVLLATETSNLACGPCTLRIDPTAAWVGSTLTNAVGTGSVALAIPANPTLAGASFVVQWATPQLFGGGACATFGVDLSNALKVVIQ